MIRYHVKFYLIGYLAGLLIFLLKSHYKKKILLENVHDEDKNHNIDKYPAIYVGVITSSSNWNSRAKSIVKTWGKHFSYNINFFMGNDVILNASNLIIRVKTNDRDYPPQRKSFLMLKYMYENLIDKYDWFVRADDDVYLFYDNLKNFLKFLDSSNMHYIGKQGFGRLHEKEFLGLPPEGFCMGGTSVILSRQTLKKLGPHLTKCLDSTVSIHEDTELGRCIFRFTGLTCVKKPNIKEMFVHGESRVRYFKSHSNFLRFLDIIALHPIRTKNRFKKIKKIEMNLMFQQLLRRHYFYETEFYRILNNGTTKPNRSRLQKNLWTEFRHGSIFGNQNEKTYIRRMIRHSVFKKLRMECEYSVTPISFEKIFFFMDKYKIHFKVLVQAVANTNYRPSICKTGKYVVDIEKKFLNEIIIESIEQLKHN